MRSATQVDFSANVLPDWHRKIRQRPLELEGETSAIRVIEIASAGPDYALAIYRAKLRTTTSVVARKEGLAR
jgi:hypothetical protein